MSKSLTLGNGLRFSLIVTLAMFGANVALIAGNAPAWLQPLSWTAYFRDMFVMACGLIGDWLASLFVVVAEHLEIVLRQFRPACEESTRLLLVSMSVLPSGVCEFWRHFSATISMAYEFVSPTFTWSVAVLTVLLAKPAVNYVANVQQQHICRQYQKHEGEHDDNINDESGSTESRKLQSQS
jgi:hypothetical protein